MQTPGDIEETFSKAYALHQSGHIDEAENLYQVVLAAAPGHVNALNLTAAARLRKGDRAGFLHYIERSLAIKPLQPAPLNNRGSVLYELGRYEEAADSFHRAIALSPGFGAAHHNLGNALHKLKRYEEAAASHERAIKILPDKAEAHFERGNALRKLKMHAAALACHERAIALKADYWQAHFRRGDALAALDRQGEAVTAYRKTLELKPDVLAVLNNLGIALQDHGRLEDAVACYEQVLRLNPHIPQAETNLGRALDLLGRIEEALLHYDAALRIDPAWPSAKWNKANALLSLGRYREGWALYETRLDTQEREICELPAPRWDGTPFPGKTLLLSVEQGFGDALQFVRYAALCKERGGKVMVFCPKPLLRLFGNCPYVDFAVDQIRSGDFDCKIELMSLPHLFGTTLEDIPAAIPYLQCDPKVSGLWAARLGSFPAPKVGLVWAGSSHEDQIDAHRIDRRRSMSLAQLQPLLSLPGTTFFSLQMGKAAGQIDELGLRERIIDLTSHIDDFMDTAGLVQNLDLVISVDTSVAHLAGALGKPVWVLSRFDACWRWLRNRPSNPWYPTARVFGQPAPGDWQTVTARVRQALEQEF
jgi:tetratricopeptide (TPR) repeat protein